MLAKAYAAVCLGDADQAERLIDSAIGGDQAVARYDFYATLDPVYGTLVLRGFIALLRNDLEEAERYSLGTIADARRTRHPDALYRGLALAGLIRLRAGDSPAALALVTEGLRESTRLGLTIWQRYALAPVAAATAAIDPVKGATLLAAVGETNLRDDRILQVPIARAVDQATIEVQSAMGADNYAQACQLGASMRLNDAIELALSPSRGQ